MSTYRDSLPAAERPAFDEAAASAMDIYSAAWADLFEFAQAHGMREAAERCAFPGRDVDAIEAKLREIYEQGLQQAGIRRSGPG